MSKAQVSCGEWVSSDESNRRAGGRRRWLGVRRLRARVRRHQLVRLCAAEGLHYGCRVRWANALQVAPSTITADLAIILRRHPLEARGGAPADRASGRNQCRRGKERAMVKRVTVRLRSTFYRDLKRLAHQQGRLLAGFIRDHLEAVMTQAEASASTASPQDVMSTAGAADTPPRP
jgi:hypothetical protein